VSNPVRGERSWGAELMSWVGETLPNLLNGRQAGQEGEALFALWEQWEADHMLLTAQDLNEESFESAPTAAEPAWDETPETE
jgi:hypothetical protein